MPSPDASGLAGQLARFASVGAIGFAVDLGATLVLAHWLGPDAGRIAAIVIAVAVTFALNRRMTFRSDDPAILHQALRYALVSAGGALVNFGGYRLALALFGSLGFSPATIASLSAAVAAGSVLAMGFNFLGAKIFAFTK